MNLFFKQKPKPQPIPEKTKMAALTKTSLEQMIIQIEADPLAGKGHLSKREILIDRILAHVQTCAVTPKATAAPVLTEQGPVIELNTVAPAK